MPDFHTGSPTLDKLSGEAFERWDNHQSFINTRLAVRDRLRREARLNAELLGKMMKGIENLIEELSTNTLQQVY